METDKYHKTYALTVTSLGLRIFNNFPPNY
jgi:hypothetical protein